MEEVPSEVDTPEECSSDDNDETNDISALSFALFTETESQKRVHRLFFALIERAFVNSIIIYKDINGELSLLDFRRKISNWPNCEWKHSKQKSDRPSSSLSSSNLHRLCQIAGRKENFRFSKDIRIQNTGGLLASFLSPKEEDMNYVQLKKINQDLILNVILPSFLCCNESKNCFSEYHQI